MSASWVGVGHSQETAWLRIVAVSSRGGGLELDVGDRDVLVPSLPDGHLRVVSPDYTGGADRDAEWTHYGVGGVVLALLLMFAVRANSVGLPGRT